MCRFILRTLPILPTVCHCITFDTTQAIADWVPTICERRCGLRSFNKKHVLEGLTCDPNAPICHTALLAILPAGGDIVACHRGQDASNRPEGRRDSERLYDQPGNSTRISTRRLPSTGRIRRRAGYRADVARGSGKQARSVIDGLARRGDFWPWPTMSMRFTRRRNRACCPAIGRRSCRRTARLHLDDRVPGAERNPKHIKDWDDLVKAGVEVITPNPKTSAERVELLAAGICSEARDGHLPKPASGADKAQQQARIHQGPLYPRQGARLRRPRSTMTSCNEHGRRAAGVGERGVPVDQRVGAGQVRDRCPLDKHSCRADRGGGRQERGKNGTQQVAEAY